MWLKQFDAVHVHKAPAFNELIQEDQEMDEWLTEGNTFLIPKSEETQPPTNNVQTFNRNHHRNDAPPPNTTRRPRGRTEEIQERMLQDYRPPITKQDHTRKKCNMRRTKLCIAWIEKKLF